MKKRLLELRTELDDVSIPVPDQYKLILLNYNLYSCFNIAIAEEFDEEKYRVFLTRALLYYLSAPFTNYDNRIGFVKSFYESYMMFDHESIVTSITDTTSILFDDSLESFLGRALAIADTFQEGFCRSVFLDLEKSLQKEKNVI